MNNKVYVLTATNDEDYMESSLVSNLLVFKDKETATFVASELNKYSTLEAEMRRVLEKVCDDEHIIDEIIDKVFEYYHDGQIEFNVNELCII